MSYFTGNRLRDLFMLLQISFDWGRLYPEHLDIVDNSKQEDDALPDTDGVPDAQGWITWEGGECPIPDAKVGEYEIRFGNGEINAGDICDAIHWHLEHIFNGADYNIVAYRLVKPDHSQVVNSEQSVCGTQDGYSIYQTHYPQFSGWFNARVVKPPTSTQKIRVARADKSVSEGYKYDFDWGDLGINTIIGWKYL